MSLKALPSKDALTALLDYDIHTGKLYWKERPESMFSGEGGKRRRAHRSWNRKYAGKEAFTATVAGYRIGAVLGDTLRANRVIWKMVHDEEPENVDHENGQRSDNRLSNLRGVTPLGNARNASRREDNRSGVTGVCFKARERRWQAYINVGGKPRTIGTYKSFSEAVEARASAAQINGYHKNHGRIEKAEGSLT